MGKSEPNEGIDVETDAQKHCGNCGGQHDGPCHSLLRMIRREGK